MPLIRIWVYDGILASGVAGIVDVLTAANTILAERQQTSRRQPPLLRWRVESLDGKPVQTASGPRIEVDGAIADPAVADAVVITAPFVDDIESFFGRGDLVAPLLEAIRRQHARGTLLASYCTGSFLLAEAGLLDGGVATTHWAKAQAFAARYPKVDVRVSEILTEQDRIICSGAATTSLNLALRLLETFVGFDVAHATGRMMLIDMDRLPQSSYATLPERTHADPLVARAQRRMQSSLQCAFSLAELSRELAVSERTLNRRFKAAIGEAPLRYLQSLRVAVARRLLEKGEVKVESIGARVGYHDPSTFRSLFRRETGLSPRDYQRRFGLRTERGPTFSAPGAGR